MECHSKLNVTQNGISLKGNTIEKGMSFKMECLFKNGMSLKMECPLKWKFTPNGMSLQMECHSNWNVTQNKCH